MIYLDSAATTLQKPASVPRAAAWAMTHLASPGRGGYPASAEAADVMFHLREEAASLFGVPNPEQVILTGNATHGLNIAIRSLVRPGDPVLLSGYEHNAVTRPLRAAGARIFVARSPLFDQDAAVEAFAEALHTPMAAVVCTMVSNVFGFLLPIDRIAALCREKGVPLIVDASQGAGTLPVDLAGWGASFVAMPGHKGLYGPQGTGLLLCGGDAMPLLYGGTGSLSRQQEMPDFLPDRLEAGTGNVHGAAGLLEGMRFVRRTGLGNIARREGQLTHRLAGQLQGIPGVSVYQGPHMAGVLSITSEGMDPETLGERLAGQGIAVRAGLHCAPLAHQTAGTLRTGTVRFSFSAFNRPEETDAAASAVRRILHTCPNRHPG